MNCSAPPRSRIVTDCAAVQPVKKLKRSPPTCFSSKSAQQPSTPADSPLHVACIAPPHAAATRLRSSSATRPAQKSSRSAKYCVARSPMGSRERTTCAPVATMASSLS
jgi:hypothetical protein